MAMSNKVKSALGALAAVAVVGTGIGVASANANNPTPAATSQVQAQIQSSQAPQGTKQSQQNGAPDGQAPGGDMEQQLASQLASALNLDESTVLKALQEVRQELMGADQTQPQAAPTNSSEQNGQASQDGQPPQGAPNGDRHGGGPRGGLNQEALAKALAAKLNVAEADVLKALQAAMKNMQPPSDQQPQSQATTGSTGNR